MKLLRGAVLLAVMFAATAVRAPCATGGEGLGLTPTGSVTLDGFSLQRSTTSGRYEATVTRSSRASMRSPRIRSVLELGAIDEQQGNCPIDASALTLTVVDPFSGVTNTVTATR